MTVYFVGAGPGDPDLLTCRASRLLSKAEVCIYAGSLVSPEVVALCPPEAVLHNSATLTLEEIVTLIREADAEGKDIVRLHTGDPSLYGATGEQARALDELGIAYDIVPGVSSFQAAAAALRCELTAPEISQTVILSRAPGRTPVPDSQTIERIAPLQATLCLFLSVSNIYHIAQKLIPEYGGDCPAAVVYRASWPEERVLRGTLATISQQVVDAGITKTALIIVGHALGRSGPVSRLYADDFAHGYRKQRES
jgi:precorrin-4/cobalt-precorrin-4 C11-methyltransferase